MRKNLKSIIGLMLFFFFIGGHSTFAESNNSLSKNELLDLENEINEFMNEEFYSLIQASNDDVIIEIEKVSVELKQSTLELYDYDKEKIIDAFKQETKELKKSLTNTKVDIIKNETQKSDEISTLSVNNHGSYYTAQVWAGLPAAGWGYINQDFTASNITNKIANIVLLGPSYKSGVLISSWTPNRSWFEVQQYAFQADIYMKGLLQYVFKGSPIALTATFKETVSAFDL